MDTPSVELEGRGRKVLCIDDEPTLVKATLRRLEWCGFRVVGMRNPVEAVRRFELDPDEFDVVVVDYLMPKMTGFEVI